MVFQKHPNGGARLAGFLNHQQYSPEANPKGVGGGYVLGGPKQPSSFQEGIQLDVLGMYRVK